MPEGEKPQLPPTEHPMRKGILGEHINSQLKESRDYRNSSDGYIQEIHEHSLGTAAEAIDFLTEGIITPDEAKEYIAGHLTKRQIESGIDDQTGALNKFGMRRRLEKTLSAAHRRGESVIAGYLDQRRFKEINDRFGHNVGDWLIKFGIEYASQNLLRRGDDYIGREGGDEMLLILPQSKTESPDNTSAMQTTEEFFKSALDSDGYADHVKKRLREEIAKAQAEGREAPNISDEVIDSLTPSIRFGLAISQPGDTAISLIQRADQNMIERREKLEPEASR